MSVDVVDSVLAAARRPDRVSERKKKEERKDTRRRVAAPVVKCSGARDGSMGPPPQGLKPGQIKDPKIAALFSTKDPDARFDDLKEIGHGSFGAVFYAFDKERGETVAIKKMSYSGKQAAEKWIDVIKEVQFLTSLRHENIVEYRASFLKESTCWLVMEYCIGSAADLVDVLKKGLREVEIAAICHSTLAALAYLHSLGRIHRDVKAGNILLNDAGCVKLADFGSSSMVSPARTFIGTPFFMAPEVILAMDDGEYAERADIWSLGITAIELAERRPPLFSMNAMSALYHIAQNEPPTLAPVEPDAPSWSPAFVSFVGACLKKEPGERMTTAEAQQHSFVRAAHAPHVVVELIARTKRLVRELDNNQLRKMKKLMLLDEKRGDNGADSLSLSLSTAGGGGTDDDCGIDSLSLSREGAGSERGDDDTRTTEGISSRSVSLTSLHSLQSTSGYSGSNVTGSGGGGGAAVGSTARDSNATVVSVRDEDEEGSERTESRQDASEHREGTPRRGGEKENNAAHPQPPPPPLGDMDLSHRNAREDVNTLRRSKFATLRTTKQITREQEEAKRENNVYEQMNGYQRMRQTNIKELQQLEERCRMEAEALRARLEKEMDVSLGAAQQERGRLRKVHAVEAEKRRREGEEGEKRLRKQIVTKQGAEMAAYSKVQLKEYKYNKEMARTNMKEHGMSKGEVESTMREVKVTLAVNRQSAERAFEMRQRKEAEDELVAYKKACTGRVHTMEERHDEEEHELECRLGEAREKMLHAHHTLTAEQERAQLKETLSCRARHLRAQHEEEMRMQREYERRTSDELMKRHALQSKQQPRELKLKEALIRKQYRQAVKTQTRQFKVWQTQLLAAASREEQKEISIRLKDEQKRKLAMLGVQYESQIESMVQEKTVKLETWQEEEARSSREKLAKELKELQSYQETQKRSLEGTIDKERTRLEEKIAARKEALLEKITADREQLRKNRDATVTRREERHAAERARLDPHAAPPPPKQQQQQQQPPAVGLLSPQLGGAATASSSSSSMHTTAL
ncbi:kin-18 [Pristionchus pacificus]|uniref:non-specific serine/threonine protein kinase n=1 Tax=Pristionchus pacificus TaxID=54126 RepID=A0A2A6CIL3_PRIPA|nr:kin-18 [Pristionchus pacificus]|eukprot:PDM77918.1 kin-18 [Pristionchus pacificus]